MIFRWLRCFVRYLAIAMLRTLPLFRIDPGWLFIAAGLTICAAGIILPAQQNLESLQRQLESLRLEESRALARLSAHAEFLDDLDRLEPALIKRLAAAQLNVVPEGDAPMLLASTPTSPLTDWIDSTVDADIRPPAIRPVSLLGRMANGPHRLWMFAGGIMCVFVGVLLGPSPLRSPNPKLQSLAQPVLEPEEAVATDGLDSEAALDGADVDEGSELQSEAEDGEFGGSERVDY